MGALRRQKDKVNDDKRAMENNDGPSTYLITTIAGYIQLNEQMSEPKPKAEYTTTSNSVSKCVRTARTTPCYTLRGTSFVGSGGGQQSKLTNVNHQSRERRQNRKSMCELIFGITGSQLSVVIQLLQNRMAFRKNYYDMLPKL